jgi:hypothetical protein
MKPGMKSYFLVSLVLTSFLLVACSGFPQAATSSGTGTAFTIGGAVTGLSGTGLVLQDNAGDNLTVTASGPFTFKTSVAGAYAVTILTQPTSPSQTCTVTGGTGTATANVTSVQIGCSAPSATIGGTVSGLTGTGLVLQDNGGDSLTITKNGTFTFKTAVTNGTYAVTVLTQPVSPNQLCTVANGSGTATANVTNVAVTCVLSYTIGGNVNGVTGSGLVLQDNGGNNLAIKTTGASTFTFTQQIATGGAYAVTILTQPSTPSQTCLVTSGAGTATANVTNVQINCPAVTFSIGGSVVGLEGPTPTPPTQIDLPLTDNSFELENNLGNTLIVTQNGPFTFATPEALNDQYEISVFHGASTQPQGCTLWDYKGVVTANVTDILIDCAHDDWTWIDGTNIAGVVNPPAPQYGTFATSAPTTSEPNPYTNTPGARYGAAGWTDGSGNLFLFGGHGWELTGNPSPNEIGGAMNDMWACFQVPLEDYCEWELVGGYDATVVGTPPNTTTVGAEIQLAAQEAAGWPFPVPVARLGAATWTDSSGNFWLFGGSDVGAHFLNDLWKYNPAGATTTSEGTWTSVVSLTGEDQAGNYTTAPLNPGSRTNPLAWTDASGNFWMFGGYGYDANGHLGFLNDLWEYTSGAWVFVSGGTTNQYNQNGNYGTQGTAASTNMPGGRQEAAGWADASGNLWLFGGEGLDSVGTANGILNDLWVYNIVGNTWTWVGGSNKANQTGAYPNQTVTGPFNTTTSAGTCGLASGNATLSCSAVSETGVFPGSRWGASAWIDENGNMWILGGWGLDSTGTNGNGALNDLWVYTPNSTPGQLGTWAWIKGSNTGAQNGVYGDETRPYLTHNVWTPGGRSNATAWVDKRNQLWLFGGEGYDSTSTTGNGYLNDLWRYLPYP